MTIGLDPFRALRRHRQQWGHAALFKRSYERADLQVTTAGLDPEASAAAIDARLGGT